MGGGGALKFVNFNIIFYIRIKNKKNKIPLEKKFKIYGRKYPLKKNKMT